MLSFSQFLLQEKVLSIGINPEQEHLREKHRREIFDILKSSYSKIGGYSGLGHTPEEEDKAIHTDISNSMIKAVRRNKNIVAVSLYRDQHGRKTIALGTDGSAEGKVAIKKIMDEDNKQKRSWGEVSGAAEHLQTKMGFPRIPSELASTLIHKPHTVVGPYSIERTIGGKEHIKTLMGHPKIE